MASVSAGSMTAVANHQIAPDTIFHHFLAMWLVPNGTKMGNPLPA
jgi:hypothetical protein